MNTTTLDGVRYVATFPPGSAPTKPAVLIHGLGETLDVWNYVNATLGATTPTIAFDLPGSGVSEFRGATYDLTAVAHESADFLRRLGVRNAPLVGHSLGALVALEMAANDPELCERVVLVDPVLFSVEATFVDPAAFVSHPAIVRALLAQFAFALSPTPLVRALLRYPWAREVATSSYVYDPRGLDPTVVRSCLGPTTPHNRLRLFRVPVVARRVELARLVERVHAPIYLVRGEADPLVTESDVDRLAALPGFARDTAIPRCGHVPMLERPAELASVLSAVLADGERT